VESVRVRSPDGTGIQAEAHGEGPVLVLSCAFCTTRENWRANLPALTAAGYRVVLWDYRGHGASDVPDGPEAWSMERVVEDLGAVLERLAPGGPAVLGGLSFGGLCSLHFALRHPGRVRALVLVDSGPGFKKPEAQAAWQEQVERTASFVQERGLRAFVDGKAGATCVGRRPELPAARAAADAIAAQDPAGLARFGRYVAGPAPAVIDELSRIEAPALVVVGEEDRAYRRAADVMAARLPNARKVVLPGAGHIVNIEAPEAFERAVVDFLDGIPG